MTRFEMLTRAELRDQASELLDTLRELDFQEDFYLASSGSRGEMLLLRSDFFFVMLMKDDRGFLYAYAAVPGPMPGEMLPLEDLLRWMGQPVPERPRWNIEYPIVQAELDRVLSFARGLKNCFSRMKESLHPDNFGWVRRQIEELSLIHI